jgi:hypothetical protein
MDYSIKKRKKGSKRERDCYGFAFNPAACEVKEKKDEYRERKRDREGERGRESYISRHNTRGEL